MINGLSAHDLAFIKAFIKYSYRELVGDEYEEIRLILALSEPFEVDVSFYGSYKKYLYNEKIYQITYQLSENNLCPLIIEELIEIKIPDK